MAYLIDANVLIQAKNQHYGFDFAPGFWDWLVDANAAGLVHSIEAVYNELIAGDDDLSQWAKANRGFFLPTTEIELASIAAVNRWANNSPDYEWL